MKILVLDDGIKGNTNQSIGIAEALCQNFDVLKLQFKGPSYILPKRKGRIKIVPKVIGLLLSLNFYALAFVLIKFFSKQDIPKEHYDLVISAGSLLAPVNLVISKRLKSKSICIMTPEGSPIKKFDLLLVPLHDSLRYSYLKKLRNVFFTIGAPNRVTSSLLEESRKKLAREIYIPEHQIKVAIIIGGNDQNYYIDIDWTKNLFRYIKKLTNEKYIFFLTVSRRTPTNVVNFLFDSTNTSAFLYREFPGTKQNSHYFGILAVCDIFFVTEDSVTMLSEVCSTGKPVIVVGVKRRKKKKLIFDATIENLVKNGYCAYIPVNKFNELTEVLELMLEKKSFPILNESKRCAEKIAELLNSKES
ncbi:MAG: mitochondrial fission ELM1 family protein [bacterium]|nr:mitochondrial fission ELM1 family protein [bacterium]